MKRKLPRARVPQQYDPWKLPELPAERCFEAPDTELILRAERWQRLWAYLAGEDVRPLRPYTTKNTTFEFSVHAAFGLLPARTRKGTKQLPSEIDSLMERWSRFTIAAGQLGLTYEKQKRAFYDHVDAAFATLERKARQNLRKAGRLRLLEQTEMLAAYLLYERLGREQRTERFPIIARALWPEPYTALEDLKRARKAMSRFELEKRRDRLRRRIATHERRAKRRVHGAQQLIDGGWRELFVSLPVRQDTTSD